MYYICILHIGSHELLSLFQYYDCQLIFGEKCVNSIFHSMFVLGGQGQHKSLHE